MTVASGRVLSAAEGRKIPDFVCCDHVEKGGDQKSPDCADKEKTIDQPKAAAGTTCTHRLGLYALDEYSVEQGDEAPDVLDAE